MKMTELRAENESLRQQIQLLSQQKEDGEKDSTAIDQLKEKNRALRKTVKDLKAENASLTDKIQTLDNEQSAIRQELQALKAELEGIQQQYSELSGVHARTTTEMESLRADHKALQEKAAQLPVIQAELVHMQQVENFLNEKTTQAKALQTELEQRNQLLEEVRDKAAKDVIGYQDELGKVNSEMETARNSLLAELEGQREQSVAQIASLQAQKDGLSAKVTDLTEKLKLVARHLERQIAEKQKMASQYETGTREYQTYKEKTEKQNHDLMGLLQKMASELDALRAAHPTQETPPAPADGDKPTGPLLAAAVEKQSQQKMKDLQEQVAELDQINAKQAGELAELNKRMDRIQRALGTPMGRLLASLLGVKK